MLVLQAKMRLNLKSSGHRYFSTKKTAGVNNITGFHLWQSFKTVVKLTENMRHVHDPCYGDILKRLRIGDQTQHDFEVLNTRYLESV